jgi:8-oxo-dGTP diphosphatase
MNNRPHIGLGVLLFNSNNEILLGKRINSHGELSFGPPGGHLEFGESIEECAIREVFEETSVKIENPEFLAVTNDIFESENKHYLSIFMKASCRQNQEIINCKPHKIIEWKWFAISALPEPLFLPLQQLVEGKAYGLKQPLQLLN